MVVLKIAFYWLNASAYRSMAKMKAINPKVMALRERLKDKPQEMQQEMMRIYREEKVNPLGGCLPILVQMPFFIALYWVLLSSVEMRNAPWIGWITDLAAKDPWFILPILIRALDDSVAGGKRLVIDAKNLAQHADKLTVGTQEILKRISESYRRMRNTVRFLLGNLADFFDWGTMLQVAGRMPQVTFHFHGPVHPRAASGVHPVTSSTTRRSAAH